VSALLDVEVTQVDFLFYKDKFRNRFAALLNYNFSRGHNV
jgi:hypothetical protein